MKKKATKTIMNDLALQNITFFKNIITQNFFKSYEQKYISEIKKISQAFNIRLKREEKLLFCKQCNTVLNANTRNIRINKDNNSIEHICQVCGFVRRFRYK